MPDEKVAPPQAPAAGDNKSEPAKVDAGTATPNHDELVDTAIKTVAELKDDAPADAVKAAREVAAKALVARDAWKKTTAEEKVKAETAAKAKADADAKAAEEAKKSLFVSADQLKFPDKTLVPKTHLETLAKEALEGKLSLSAAQKMLDRDHALAQAIEADGQARLKAQGEAQLSQIKNDPTLGGTPEKLNETNQKASRAFRTVFGEDEFQVFAQSVFVSRPGIVKGLVKLANMIGESKLVADALPAQGPAKAKSLGSIVYPKGGNVPDVGVTVPK